MTTRIRQTINIFHFWGAGNIGDDLMLDGFLHGLGSLGVGYEERLSSLCAFDVSSQQFRFPSVQWINAQNSSDWLPALTNAELLIGAGDTPFQLTSGDWLLRHLNNVFNFKSPKTEVVFINVGAEREIFPKRKDFAAILQRVSKCSTRDSSSLAILRDISPDSSLKLSLGGDLASISLARNANIFTLTRKFKLGIILGFDTLSPSDLASIRTGLSEVRGPIAFITGDCRDGQGFESHLFKSWTKSWFSPLRKKLVLRRPKYDRCALAELIQPISECDIVLSSRFHGLLSAAWLGCRVGALGRSSKVVALANEFGIPCVEPPFATNCVRLLMEDAVKVPQYRLNEYREQSLEGILACKFW